MNGFKRAIVAVLDCLLPRRLKNSMFHVSYHLARKEFEWFAHQYGFAPHMDFGLEAMAARGFAPKTVVDVGAFEGGWSRTARRIWPSTKLVMVEPNRQKEDLLRAVSKELDAALLCELVGAEDGKDVEFHVMGSGSSVLEERSGVPRSAERRKLRTLDALLGGLEGPALLKVDAQGYELQILKGASGILPRIEAVLLEVAVIEINAGAPLLHEVVAFMKSCGFVAYDILEIHRRPLDRALNQVDIVFIREQSPLIADKRHYA